MGKLIKEIILFSIYLALSTRLCEGSSTFNNAKFGLVSETKAQKLSPLYLKSFKKSKIYGPFPLPIPTSYKKHRSQRFRHKKKQPSPQIKQNEAETVIIENKNVIPEIKNELISLVIRVENLPPEDTFSLMNEIDSDLIEVESELVKNKLIQVVSPDKILEFDKTTRQDSRNHWISLKSLKELGYKVEYDQNRLFISIKIPAEKKEKKIISVGKIKEIAANDNVSPNEISGFMNFYYNKNYYNGNSSSGFGNNPSITYIDNSLNIKKWVLESTGSYVQNKGYIREQIRLVRDDEKYGVRYSIGDVTSSYGGFLSSTQVGGINVSTKDEITPYKIAYPINEHEILVKTTVSIQIMINGFSIYSADIESGTYDINNFPFAGGMNDTIIVIKDYYTKEVIETIPFASFAYSRRILRMGDHIFDYTAGYSKPGFETPGSIKILDKFYNQKDPNVTISHNYGLLDRITLTGYGQFKPSYSLLGLGVAASTPLGVLTLENASSQNARYNTKGLGSKIELWNYRHAYSFKLGYEKRFNEFSMANESFGAQSINYAFSGNLGVKLSPTITSFGAGNLSEYLNNNKTWETNLGLNKRLSQSMLIGLVGTYGKLNVESPIIQKGARIDFTWNIDSNSVFYAKTDTITQQDQIHGSYSQSLNDKVALGVSGGVTRSIGENNYDGSLQVSSDKGRIGLNHNEAQRIRGSSGQTSITAETGIAFAGNTFAWTRPVSRAFVIFKGDGALSGQDVLVNPSSDFKTGQAETDFLGTALIQSEPYSRAKFIVALPDLKDGLFLHSDNYDVISTYKSGTLINIFAEQTVTMKGTLIGSDNLPLGEVSGEMRLTESKSKDEPLFFFTNDKGNFIIEGVKNKEYEIVFFNSKENKLKIIIPQGITGGFEMGELHAPFVKKN